VAGAPARDVDRGPLRLATRASPLAREQTRRVAQRLEAIGCPSVSVVIEPEADRRLELTIGELAGHGVFVGEIERCVALGDADVAVHSAKDLPASAPLSDDGLVLAAVPERGDPRDALVGESLSGLKPGASVATGSARRLAQLASLRPDLCFVELRGNIARRLERLPPGGAVVVAAAALERLGLSGQAAQILPVSTMLPQVGQGAIALRCRAGDRRTLALLARIDDDAAHRCVRAERAFLARLGGGCDAPVGAYAVPADGHRPGWIELEGLLASADGHVVVRARKQGDDPEALGGALAQALLEEAGGRSLVAT